MDAEFEVSGESIVGSRGAKKSDHYTRYRHAVTNPLLQASLTYLASHPRPLT